ncbi:MAG TPA: hypothetical protein VF170_04630 [Planctomycetaceae bacterium]
MSDSRLVELLRDAAAIHGPAITLSKFLQWSGELDPAVVAKLLVGWEALRKDAGLPAAAPRLGRKRFTHDDLMAEYDRVRRVVGRDPTWGELNRHSAVSRQTFQDRFGPIAELRKAHREWADLRDRAAGGNAEAVAELKQRALAAGTIPQPADDILAGILDNLGPILPRKGKGLF